MVWGLNIAALAGIALTNGLIFTQLYARVNEIQPQIVNVLFVTVHPVALANTQCILLYSERNSVFKMNLLSYGKVKFAEMQSVFFLKFC